MSCVAVRGRGIISASKLMVGLSGMKIRHGVPRMNSRMNRLLVTIGIAAALVFAVDAETIKRLGTIDYYIVETSPIVFKGRPWLFEWIRGKKYAGNADRKSVV